MFSASEHALPWKRFNRGTRTLRHLLAYCQQTLYPSFIAWVLFFREKSPRESGTKGS